MLGAQARAAEYNAFKAASARQASREAEEHKLPLKPAPVALSAFTKNTQLNRNKGPKAWIPLVLEDTPEEDKDTPEDNEGSASTPTRLRSVDHSNSVSDDTDVSVAPADLQTTRASVKLPFSAIPTAPRALLRMSQTPSTLMNPTPQRIQSHSIIRQAQNSIPASAHSSPGGFNGISGYPYPSIKWRYGLHSFPNTAPAPMTVFEPAQYSSNIMAPDDISPTKQETKLASLSHQVVDLPPNLFISAPGNLGASMLPRIPVPQHGDDLDGGSYPQNNGLMANPAQRPTIQHINSDSAVDLDGSHSETSSLPMPHISRHRSYPDGARAVPNQQSTISESAGSTSQLTVRPRVSLPSGDEPYDRKTKMQSFVAAQQALAKTGKTVLHNPDLHRVKASGGASLAAPGNATTTPEHEYRGDASSPRPTTFFKPTPGFDSPGSSYQGAEADAVDDPSPLDAATLREIFGVNTENWLELEPVTKFQRMKMSRVIKLFSSAQSPETPQGFAQRSNVEKRAELMRWMHLANRDTKPITATRKIFEDAARERLSTSTANSAGRGDPMSKSLSDAEVECAAICAVGDIMATLIDDNNSSGAPVDSDPLFGKYKNAPEYAIERGRLLMGKGGSMSFFEDHTGGFYNAPSRIARDPRFRPAGKEDVKIKQEESWKHRADIYGRRRV